MKNTNSFFKKTLALLLSIVFAISSFAVTGISALADDGEYFLMAYFTGNLQIEQQIKFAVSTNGKDFKPLYGGNAVLQEKSTDTNNYNGYTYTDGIRDPFIFDGHDGYYYCIATDLEATAYGFWGNQSQMVLWRSKDLINWSDAYYINVAQISNYKRGTNFNNSDFQRTWAPEVFYEDGQYMIYFALAGGDYTATRMYYMLTDDLFDWTHYSAPQKLYDPGADDIDADIIKEGSTYYMFYKDETEGRKTVCLATASALTGPYTYVGQFNTSSGTGAIEGCEVYTVGNDYYLVADRYGAAGNFAIYNMGPSLAAVAAKGANISVSDSNPISTVEEYYGYTNLTPRHGSIMHISQSQYNALVADSGGVTDNDIMYNFTKSYSNTTTGWAYETYNDSSLHDVNLMFKENGSSAKVAHDAGYITLKNATMFVNDETVRAMFPDDVYTVSFNYSLESTTNLSAPIFALGTGSGAPSANTDYVMMFGNGDMWVRKSGENTDTFVANKALKLGVTYHYDVVSDGTNIKFFRDGELIGSIAATVDFPTTGTRYAAFGFTDGHSSAGYGYGSYSRIRFRDRAVSSTEIKDESNALLYRKDDGTETINNKDNALNVSHSGNHNVAEPITSHIASSYSIAGWVNPGASVDYNSVIMGIGSGKWTPGPSGRYLAIREDGTILFNYCSGSNSGGNWSQHYVDINSAFSLSTNTWAYLQVNIVPISDNQVKFVVFKDGVQTLAQDITLTTKVDDNDTNGNDYAYGMLGMLQLTTNNIYLGRMEVPSWWQNENGTTYVKDVRFYAQAMDPDNLYREVLINRDAATARDYVRANLENYDVNANANKANRNAYHYESIATGGFNNVLASSYNDTVCADDEYDADWGRYKWFWPRNIVLMYDGVNTPALPVTFETHMNSGWGQPSNKYLNTVYVNQSSSPNFKNAHYWTGYLNGDWTSWPGATMPYAYKDYPADDGWNNGNPGGKNEVSDGYTHIGYDAGWQYDWQYTYNNTSTHRFFWNKVNYTGTVDEDDYYETYTKINYSSYDGSDRHFTDIDHNIYVVNYKPVYDILKSGSTVNVPNESDNLLTVYNSVKDNESDYTTDSLNQFYYAAYKLLTSNPVEYSEAAYQADFSGTVTLAANEIKAAMNEFNTINLVERASFTDFNTAANEAKDILDNNADGYTAASIENLQTVVDSSTYFTYDEDEKANTSADHQSAINAEEDAITAAINALVAKIVVTYDRYSEADVVVKFEPGASAADVEAAAPALTAAHWGEGNTHVAYEWDKAFAAATANTTYTETQVNVPHDWTYTYFDGENGGRHISYCHVSGFEHSAVENCVYTSEHTAASGNTNGYTTYTCQYCSHQYVEYDTQNWTAYDTAVAAYDAKAAEEDFTAKYTEASRTAFASAASNKLTKADTVSQSAIDNATTALENAVSNLAIQNYTITYKYWGVATTESAVLPYGASAEDVAAEAPENTATNYSETRHYTFAWETFAAVTADKTYNEQRTSTAHSYDSVHTNADADANGFTTYTCACGHSYVEYDSTNSSAYTDAVAEYNAIIGAEDYEAHYTEASRTAYEDTVAAVMNTVDTSDNTKSDAYFQSKAAEITAAKDELVVDTADFSAVVSAIAEGNNKIDELKNSATVYTEATVSALVTAVANAEAAYANAGNYKLADQETVNAFASAIENAIAGLSTEPVIDPTADEDVVDNYDAAIDRIKNLDTDMYDLGGSTIEEILEFCISTAAEENESNITTIDVLDDDALEAITAACLAQLQSMVKLYTINVSGDLDDECPVESIFTGELQTIEAGKKYKVKANTRVLFNASSKATAWYMSYSIDGVDRRSRQYQGKGAAIELPVVGDIDIDAVQETADAPNMVTINRTYSDNTESKYVIQCVEFTKDTYTLPAAPALPFYEFANYSYGENVYQAGDVINGISEDIVVKANYTFIGTANEYAVNITSTTEEELYSSSVSYNTKVEVYDASAYAWVTNQGKLFYIGSELTFFVAESVTLEAITYEEFIAAEYTTPAVSTRSEALLTEGKITINSQVVTQSSDKVLEYGVLVGIAKPSGSISTEDLTILNTNTTHDDYVLIRAKSTKMFGANQFTIGINTNNKGTYLYRVYAIYDIGNNMTRTVYSDVKTVEMT